ncbi:MAG: DUF4340 domain-containing protein [Halothece sp.]
MQKTTLILVLIALGLGGYVYFYEIKSNSQEQVAGNSQQNLFSFQEDQVQRLTIEKEKQTFEFVRLETSDQSWRMKQPEESPAKESAIVFLLDLLSKESSSRTFEIQRDQLGEYGFKTPLATIEVELNNNTKHRVILGKTTFNNKQIYARIDPKENKQIKIYLLPIDFQNAVNRSLSQWKQKSEAEKNKQTKPENSSSKKQE